MENVLYWLYAGPAIIIGLIGVSSKFTSLQCEHMKKMAIKNGRNSAPSRIATIHRCIVATVAILPVINIIALADMIVILSRGSINKQ